MRWFLRIVCLTASIGTVSACGTRESTEPLQSRPDASSTTLVSTWQDSAETVGLSFNVTLTGEQLCYRIEWPEEIEAPREECRPLLAPTDVEVVAEIGVGDSLDDYVSFLLILIDGAVVDSVTQRDLGVEWKQSPHGLIVRGESVLGAGLNVTLHTATGVVHCDLVDGVGRCE